MLPLHPRAADSKIVRKPVARGPDRLATEISIVIVADPLAKSPVRNTSDDASSLTVSQLNQRKPSVRHRFEFSCAARDGFSRLAMSMDQLSLGQAYPVYVHTQSRARLCISLFTFNRSRTPLSKKNARSSVLLSAETLSESQFTSWVEFKNVMRMRVGSMVPMSNCPFPIR